MAEPQVEIDAPTDDIPTGDIHMGEGGDPASGEEFSLDGEPETTARVTFLDYLRSPIVELVVGNGPSQTVLAAHQALLTKSPYFDGFISKFTEGSPRRIYLPDEDIDATGSLLEYLYYNEYFPKRLGDSKDGPLEIDPTILVPDNDGVALLKHARVYTIADKFGLPALKSLAHSKIHRTTSTARGEIAYARFVYKETSREDLTIRRPVAAFWATRSHVLRHEAEDEFRAMCLEFPQFGFDILSLVLDQKEKRSEAAGPSTHGEAPKSGRKRARVSQG